MFRPETIATLYLKRYKMKKIMLILSALSFGLASYSQDTLKKTEHTMKMNAGIITEKLAETKAFYTEVLHFGVRFENDFYLLLHTPGGNAEISFLLPEHPSQQPLFRPAFGGQGLYLTLETDNVDAFYEELRKRGIPIEIELRDEPWGDRHFAIKDPNGIGIDIVSYSAPEE